MQEYITNKLNNFIMGWYIDPKICDQLIDLYKNSEYKQPGGFGVAAPKVSIDTDVKESTDVPLSPDSVPQIYVDNLFMCAKLYTDKYQFSEIAELGLYENTQIQYYPAGGGYKQWHMEKGGITWPLVTRHLVFMTYLNDVPDGGTDFYYQGLTTKAEKGLTLIWPPEWMFTHRSHISYTSEKYIITGWLNMKTYPIEGNKNA
jgi:hypothetical protein